MLHKVKNARREILRGLPELMALLSPSARKKQLLLEMASKRQPRPHWKSALGGALRNYTSKSTITYDADFTRKITRLAPQWFLSRVEKSKKKLLEMAARGDDKPKIKEHPMGGVLQNYTSESSSYYDPEFTKKIKKLAPHWLLRTADQNKKMLLEMAKKRRPRPAWKHPLGKVLPSYISKMSKIYDPDFTRKIRKFAPEWILVPKTEVANQKKARLLDMAKKGAPKLGHDHPLVRALSNYTSKKSSTYDSDFDKKIRKIAPHWFVFKSHVARQRKQNLLNIAKKGGPRPSQKTHPLGRALSNYTQKNSDSYDAEFTKKIRKIAPHWFVPPTEKSNQKKRIMLKMAKTGKSRPRHDSKLGMMLSSYLSKKSKSYDHHFTNEIRRLAPHWFVRRTTQVANEKKQRLFAMAKNGDSRPSRKDPLGVALREYTSRFGTYDPKFAREIRRLAPHWFRKKPL